MGKEMDALFIDTDGKLRVNPVWWNAKQREIALEKGMPSSIEDPDQVRDFLRALDSSSLSEASQSATGSNPVILPIPEPSRLSQIPYSSKTTGDGGGTIDFDAHRGQLAPDGGGYTSPYNPHEIHPDGGGTIDLSKPGDPRDGRNWLINPNVGEVEEYGHDGPGTFRVERRRPTPLNPTLNDITGGGKLPGGGLPPFGGGSL